MPSQTGEHLDALNRPIQLGDLVMASQSRQNDLTFEEVIGFTEKTVRTMRADGDENCQPSLMTEFYLWGSVHVHKGHQLVIVKTADDRGLPVITPGNVG